MHQLICTCQPSTIQMESNLTASITVLSCKSMNLLASDVTCSRNTFAPEFIKLLTLHNVVCLRSMPLLRALTSPKHTNHIVWSIYIGWTGVTTAL